MGRRGSSRIVDHEIETASGFATKMTLPTPLLCWPFRVQALST
jgi:hypothetical protein